MDDAQAYPMKAKLAPLVAVLLPLLLALILYADVLGAWWQGDDPCLIASGLRHGALAHFLDPAVWRTLSGTVLMPWQILSLSLDASLFGLSPRAFYAHQLLAMGLLIVFLDLVLRRYLSAFFRGLALLLVVLSTPFAAVTRQLMNRHYAEGTLLALLALLLAIRAFERERRGPAYLGAGVLFLAMTAKEVFVPAAFLLPLLPMGSLRSRVRLTIPYLLSVGAHGVWRLVMLGPGNSFGGYGIHPVEFDWRRLPAAAGFSGFGGLLLVSLGLAAAVVWLARDSRLHWFRCLAVGLALVLPLITILPELAPRHLFLMTMAVAVALAAALQSLRSRLGDRSVQLLGVGVAGLAMIGAWNTPFTVRLANAAEQQRAEGSFILDPASDGVLRTTLPDPRFLGCLAELRGTEPGTDAGPQFCGDSCLCAPSLEVGPTWRFTGGRLVETETPPPTECRFGGVEVEMNYDPVRGRLSWRLGPHTKGRYEVLLLSGGEPPDVSRPAPIVAIADLPMTLDRPLSLVFAYQSPEGWRTYSETVTIGPGSDRAGTR